MSGITLGNYKFSRKGQKTGDTEKAQENNGNGQEDEESKSNLIKTITVQSESFNSEGILMTMMMPNSEISNVIIR